jgi:NADP-dependent 3-hydroxy acid dehydrogenase YdfG
MKTILITGATGGIGKEVARLFAEHGFDLFLTGTQEDAVAAMVKEYEQYHTRVFGMAADLREQSACQALIQRAMENLGQIDVLFLGAGFGVSGTVADGDTARIADMVAVNVLSPYYLMHEAIPHMKRLPRSHIFAIGSVAGIKYSPNYAMYSATKFAVRALMEGVRNEVQNDHIKTTVIHPGIVDTEFWAMFGSSGDRVSFPPERTIRPLDVAAAVWNAYDTPPHVAIGEIVIRPLLQER